MSERTRNLPRRSCLSVPASNEKMLAEAAGNQPARCESCAPSHRRH